MEPVASRVPSTRMSGCFDSCPLKRDDAPCAGRRPSAAADKPTARLLCMGYTIDRQSQNAAAMARTWMPACDGALIFSDADDDSVPSMRLPHLGPGEDASLWQRTRANLRHVHVHHRAEYEWFVYGGDDYYVIVDNLRALIASPRVRKASERGEALYLGRRLRYSNRPSGMNYAFANDMFNSGATYVLNRRALDIFATLVDDERCLPRWRTREEDVMLARCLAIGGVDPLDTRDMQGHHRFHPFRPSWHVRQSKASLRRHWLGTAEVDRPTGYGLQCCSTESVSFHYVKAADSVVQGPRPPLTRLPPTVALKSRSVSVPDTCACASLPGGGVRPACADAAR